jgi:hypothetical protein
MLGRVGPDRGPCCERSNVHQAVDDAEPIVARVDDRSRGGRIGHVGANEERWRAAFGQLRRETFAAIGRSAREDEARRSPRGQRSCDGFSQALSSAVDDRDAHG